jgi:hypothetical protein
MKKSAKFFGKSLLALVLGIIAVAGLAVAGLLNYYGKVVGTAKVQQSVVVKAISGSTEYLFKSYDSNGNSYCPNTNCYDSFTIEAKAGESSTNGKIDSSTTIDRFEIENRAATSTNVEVEIPEMSNLCGKEITSAGLDTNEDGNIDQYLCIQGNYTPVRLSGLGTEDFNLIISWAINAAPTSYTFTLQVAPA